VFPYGDFLNALISFLIIAAVVFFFVVRPMNRLMARFKDPAEEPDAPSAEVATLIEIRDLLATRAARGASSGPPY
jgi:large conductance mechanosensitive channel